MKSQIWICILCIEIALAVVCVAGIVQSYGRPVPAPCLKSRSIPIPVALPCMTPSVTPMKPTSGLASWYSRASCRREGTGGKRIRMANGQPLDDKALTCAMWIIGKHGRPLLPDGRLVKITSVQNTLRAVVVAWTDNGPGRVPRSRGVIVDLSKAAMMALAGPAGIKAGRVAVRLEEL